MREITIYFSWKNLGEGPNEGRCGDAHLTSCIAEYQEPLWYHAYEDNALCIMVERALEYAAELFGQDVGVNNFTFVEGEQAPTGFALSGNVC